MRRRCAQTTGPEAAGASRAVAHPAVGQNFRPYDADALAFYRQQCAGLSITAQKVQAALESLRARTPALIWKSARGVLGGRCRHARMVRRTAGDRTMAACGRAGNPLAPWGREGQAPQCPVPASNSRLSFFASDHLCTSVGPS